MNTAVVRQEIGLQAFPKSYLQIGQWEEYRDFILSVFVPAISQHEDYSGRNVSQSELW